MAQSDITQRKNTPESGRVSQEVFRKYHTVPISFYSLKDKIARLISNENIVGALLIPAAFLAFAFAFGFYPFAVIIVLAVLLFFAALEHPLLGIGLFLALVFPILMYQTPAIAWVFMFFITITLVFGYRHYRALAFTYIMIGLAFSPLGYLLEIPVFILGILTIGYKRSTFAVVAAILIIVAFSALFGVNNYSYIVYNGVAAHKAFGANPVLNYTTPGSVGFTLSSFASSGLQTAFTKFTNPLVIGSLSITISLIISSLFMQAYYLLELVALVILIFVIDELAINSRSKYKGTKASLFAAGYPIAYVAISYIVKTSISSILMIVSFALGVMTVYILELYNINVVKSLEVRKQDLRMKFGEAFEELSFGSSADTFDNIGNYESTKKELSDSILAPIEQKAISKAYNVTPTKGILFFGPPGTGKTKMMRAIANEIHGGFYYVNASNLISMYPGETEKRISEIFTIAKKHAPCVLFFDEIDFIASNRGESTADSTHRAALSELLAEMDGFQKVNDIIIVGATNTPQLIDRAILRPGRFDKIIYMPLPDSEGRKKIFQMYLGRLPVAKGVDYSKLVQASERYSGADIKTLVDTVAQSVAQEAASKHKILEITEEDLIDAIKSTKPSTNLAQVEEFNRFKVEFERSLSAGGRRVERDESSGISKIIGMDDAKQAIMDAIETPLRRPDLIKKYDVKNINGILLFGPPGNGKTLLMRGIANDMGGVNMFEINGASLASYGLESAAAKIKEIFNSARENAPSIIFIDEIEGIIPKRRGASEAATRITVEMLSELDGLKKLSGVVVIAASNIPQMLDPAILRPGRFDKLIFIKPPNEKNRKEMLVQYLGNVPLEKNLDLEEIAKDTEGFTGADIANICREAKTKALNASVKSGKDELITEKLLEDIVSGLKPSAPKKVIDQYNDFLDQYGQR
jgi:transitional endoplasmic reticulum ATPase